MLYVCYMYIICILYVCYMYIICILYVYWVILYVYTNTCVHAHTFDCVGSVIVLRSVYGCLSWLRCQELSVLKTLYLRMNELVAWI